LKKRRDAIRNYNIVKMKTWRSPALSRDTVVPERGEKKKCKIEIQIKLTDHETRFIEGYSTCKERKEKV